MEHESLYRYKREHYRMTGSLASVAMGRVAKEGGITCRAPLGYLNMTNSEGKRSMPDPARAHLVIRLFEEVAQSGKSLAELALWIAGEGLVSRAGAPLTPSTLWSLLTNPFYTGKIRFKGELLDGAHKPLVSEPLFAAAQHSLASRRK